MLSCDGTFTDWLGYKQEDMHAKPVGDMVVQRDELDAMLNRAKNEVAAALTQKPGGRTSLAMDEETVSPRLLSGPPKAPQWVMENLTFKHMYLDEIVNTECTITMGGINETALYVITVSAHRLSAILPDHHSYSGVPAGQACGGCI